MTMQLRELILNDLDRMKDKDGFNPDTMRWGKCFVQNTKPFIGFVWDKKKGIHLSKMNYHSLDDASLFNLYRLVFARSQVMM